MQTDQIDPIQFLTSGNQLVVQPLGYTITLSMLTTRWRDDSGSPRQDYVLLFEGCCRMKLSWKGELGPYDLSLQQSPNGLIEIRDSSGEFEIACRKIKYLNKNELPIFYLNLSGAQV